MNSSDLFARSLQVAPGGVHSPVRAFRSVGGTPVFFESAEGPYLRSVEGHRYIDFCMSFGPLILGHRDPEVQEVVLETIHRAWSFGACEPYSLELAEWIQERLPWVERLRFVSSGTEAVMSALRVARAATGRSRILKFDGCYHGHADSLLVKAGSGLAGSSSSDSAGVPEHVAADTLVVPLDHLPAVEEVFSRQGHEIAAVILEPLPANFGLLPQRAGYWRAVCDLAHRHGALVVFDEVISGFRVGLGGMAGALGINPDLVTYGKVLGGGFPVGAYGGRKDLMEMVAPAGRVYQAGTLSANPVGMRAGLATLQKMEREDGWMTLGSRTHLWGERLRRAVAPLGMDVRTAGSLFWLHGRTESIPRAVSQIPQDHGPNFRKFFSQVLQEHVYFAPSGFEVGFLSLAHGDEVLEDAWARVQKAVARLCP